MSSPVKVSHGQQSARRGATDCTELPDYSRLCHKVACNACCNTTLQINCGQTSPRPSAQKQAAPLAVATWKYPSSDHGRRADGHFACAHSHWRMQHGGAYHTCGSARDTHCKFAIVAARHHSPARRNKMSPSRLPSRHTFIWQSWQRGQEQVREREQGTSRGTGTRAR